MADRLGKTGKRSIPTGMGKPFARRRPVIAKRSIPTGMGKPLCSSYLPIVHKVYPHGYGETHGISAHLDLCGVYPHGYGETDVSKVPRSNKRGLSPRVWGNPGYAVDMRRLRRVYPHGYGETVRSGLASRAIEGLSPRVWGNRLDLGTGQATLGSIPTGMGKPPKHLRLKKHHQVYPHGYGETISPCRVVRGLPGLSPRVWGNQIGIDCRLNPHRSIPTGMGKPF